jgi:hypothetical protein
VPHAKALKREVNTIPGNSVPLRKKQKVIPGLLVMSSAGNIRSLLAADIADCTNQLAFAKSFSLGA